MNRCNKLFLNKQILWINLKINFHQNIKGRLKLDIQSIQTAF